jgi:hypothetical protein
MATGLRENIRNLLIDPMIAFERWFRSSLFNRDKSLPSARMAARGVLGVGINALAEIGVPRPAAIVPEPAKIHAKNPTYSAGSFSPFKWVITLPSDLADVIATPLGVEGIATSIDVDPNDVVRYILAEYADTVSHECRHCEQVYRIVQWVYVLQNEKRRDIVTDLISIYEEHFLPKASAMRKPAAPPNPHKTAFPVARQIIRGAALNLNPGSEARAEAAMWYHSMYGDMSKLYQQRRNATDIALYRDIPEEADAYGTGELVRDCLLEEWGLSLAKRPDFRIQHTNIIDAA